MRKSREVPLLQPDLFFLSSQCERAGMVPAFRPMDSVRSQPIAAVWTFPPSGFHRLVAAKPVRSETDKQNGCQVLTMVLSETRGL
jgi:hypothetical protein